MEYLYLIDPFKIWGRSAGSLARLPSSGATKVRKIHLIFLSGSFTKGEADLLIPELNRPDWTIRT